MKTLLEVNPLLHRERTGIPNYLYQLCRNLVAQDTGDELVLWGPDMDRDPLPPSRNKRFRGRGMFQRGTLEELWRRGARIGGIEADVDVYHLPYAALPAPRLGRNTRLVLTIHDLAFARHPDSVLQPGFLSHLAQTISEQVDQADHVITDSYSTARDLREILDVPEEKVSVVHLATDLKRPEAGDQAAKSAFDGLNLPQRYLLCLGTLEPRKNLSMVLRAFERLAPKLREQNLYLVLAGRVQAKYRGAEHDALALIERLGIADRVVLPGYVPDEALPLLYARAEMFLYPSLYEGFGLPVLEAMTCGTPVIASNASSLPEVAGDAALLVDPRAPEDLAGRIEQLLTTPGLREELITHGYHRAGQFSWKRAAEETAAVYRAVCGVEAPSRGYVPVPAPGNLPA